MFQKFFTDTIENKFIKSILYNTNLPNIETADVGDYLIKDAYYIYKTSIIKCTNSGYLFKSLDGDFPIATYDFIKRYSPGDYYLGITDRFVSRYNYYDPETHGYLGKYLRYIRGLYGVDLMPFYNCFNYSIISGYELKKNAKTIASDPNVVIEQVENSSNYKLIAIPIKYNRTYTISIDCMAEVFVKAGLYSRFGMIEKSNFNDSGIIKNSTSYINPFTYKVDISSYSDGSNIKKDLYDYQKCLYLFIQLPSSNTSTITVLEGDYTNRGHIISNLSEIDSATNKELNRTFVKNISLLTINDGNTYAFSSRLIEYLLRNVIDSEDPIYKNVATIQYLTNNKATGEWSNMLRADIFDRLQEINTMKDITGFADKDAEKYLTQQKLREVNK